MSDLLLCEVDPRIYTTLLAHKEDLIGKRKSYSPQFKAKVAIEAIKKKKTTSQIASEI